MASGVRCERPPLPAVHPLIFDLFPMDAVRGHGPVFTGSLCLFIQILVQGVPLGCLWSLFYHPLLQSQSNYPGIIGQPEKDQGGGRIDLKD